MAVGRRWELSAHCRARWRLSTLMTWRWVGSGQALINVGDVAAMSCPVWQGNSPGVCAMQGGDTKKNKDITSKFFLRNNLVD